MAKYEPKEVDITIAVDDTLCKGVESWAWYGLQPVNKLLKPGGTLIVTSRENARGAHCRWRTARSTRTSLAILKGTPSFSGLWVYKDDHTDVRILGAIASILPELFSLDVGQEDHPGRMERSGEGRLGRSGLMSAPPALPSSPTRAIPETPYKFEMPKWTRCGKASPFPCIATGKQMEDPARTPSAASSPTAIPHSRSSAPAPCGRW